MGLRHQTADQGPGGRGAGRAEAPGGYFTSRQFDFAFRNIAFYGDNTRTALEEAAQAINKELSKKQKEFGLTVRHLTRRLSAHYAAEKGMVFPMKRIQGRTKRRGPLRRYAEDYLFILPYYLIFVVFTILPVGTAIGLSFTYFNVLEAPSFGGRLQLCTAGAGRQLVYDGS